MIGEALGVGNRNSRYVYGYTRDRLRTLRIAMTAENKIKGNSKDGEEGRLRRKTMFQKRRGRIRRKREDKEEGWLERMKVGEQEGGEKAIR